MKFNYKNNSLIAKLCDLDFRLLLVISLVSFIGLLLMYSAAQGSLHPWAIKQSIHFLFGVGLLIAIALTNIVFWYRFAYIFYGLSLGLVILTEVMGHTAMGATRWLNLGIIKLQPSELMKITLVLALSRYFHNLHINNIRKIAFVIPPVLLVLVPCALILKQPDLGTASILLAIGGAIFFAAGVAMWKFGAVLLLALIAAPIAWNSMHDYQKQRIIIFMNPGSDRLGSGYNIIQSKIAIGSGGLFGKGLLHGSQTQLSFLPEHQTDFIFAMVSEELGLLGGITVLILYSFIILYSYRISLNCQNFFGSLMSMGAITMFFLHVFINIAMVMELVPVVGVPLPLLSYGGTIMVTVMFGFGLIMCAKIHNTPFEKDKIIKFYLNN
ncbi:MAG: rod shape-determining protein RodA [Sphingobacteriia bacterium]|nr:rod shape-determining protein RodA [Sphingobacteriia bacterium]